MSTLQFGLTPKMKPLTPNRSVLVAALDVGTSKIACLIGRQPQLFLCCIVELDLRGIFPEVCRSLQIAFAKDPLDHGIDVSRWRFGRGDETLPSSRQSRRVARPGEAGAEGF